MNRRTLTMDFDSLEAELQDDDDSFFESRDRLSTAVPFDLGDDNDGDFEDSRMSFVSAINSNSIKRIYSIQEISNPDAPPSSMPSYDMWMAEPGDLKERRKRLLQDMGLASNKDLLKIASRKVSRAASRKPEPVPVSDSEPAHVAAKNTESSPSEELRSGDSPSPELSPESSTTGVVLVRSRSDGDIASLSATTKQRKEELIGPISKQRLTRTSSGLLTPATGVCPYASVFKVSPPNRERNNKTSTAANTDVSVITDGALGSFFLIKNLDTGSDFIVKEYNKEGMWNKLNDLQTGKQLTMEEFEKSVGYSPVVKELMRRASRNIRHDNRKEANQNSYFTRSFRNSKRKGAAFLKNIKGVATSVSGLLGEVKEQENSSPAETPPKDTKNNISNNKNNNNNNNNNNNISQWVEAHQHGKSYKEFTALHLSQEIQAHEGSIWTLRFNIDARLLASAGEDGNIHVWEVQDCEVMSTREAEELSTLGRGTPLHPADGIASHSHRAPLADITSMPSATKKKGKTNGKKGNNSIPDYVNVPETVLALSEKPICTFTGHTDEVLDLAWSKSQILLSSSMDKTVRMWDLESKTCLKTFVHNDYVTCIQFNPVDDDYFISGSLDSKIRIWKVPDRKVVDWMDVREMVTAACYTPDGKGVVVGCQEGSCRMYSIDDGKLEHSMDIQKKKKPPAKKFPAFQVQAKKPPAAQAGKITGFEFAPWNPSEVLITSADSKIGIYNGSDLIQKFRGYRNTSNQISACFTPDGKHVITASEDSQIYMWKVDEPKNHVENKRRSTVTVQAHEHFACKDVTAAVPWPGSMKNEPPLVDLHPKRSSRDSKRITNPSPAISTAATSEDNNNNNNMVGDSRRNQLPPLPKKKNNPVLEGNNSGEEEELAQTSDNIDPGIGVSESFNESESIRCGDSPSISSANAASPSQSWSSSDGGNGNGNGHCIQATAWGMVIVTASLEGEIRVYQNFGLPRKVNRQTFF